MPQDLNRFFQVEAEDLLSRITAALEQAAARPPSAEVLRELRRWTHTMKGAAQVVRRDNIAQAAHQLETLLNGLTDPAQSESALGSALRVTDSIREMLFGPPAAKSAEAPDIQPSVAAEIETLRIDLRDLDGLLQTVNEASIISAGAEQCKDLVGGAQDTASMLRRAIGSDMSGRAQNLDTVADELEDVLARIRRELENFSGRMVRSLDHLRSRVEDLRLIRAETIVPALEQSAQAAAAGTGKLVAFESVGSDLEFDAHILIALRDALIQIVRNAVAHGMERPERRVSGGKSATGIVRVTFRHEAGRNLIEVEDDGAGIDFDALRRLAVERDWLTAAQATTADVEELTALILRPGVTTSAAPNMLAGRGVGLDLVNRTVVRLKGEVRVRSARGQGTTFAISVPASMSSIATLIVNAGGRKIGIPRDVVRRTVMLKNLNRLGDSWIVDGRPLSLVTLAAIMGNEPGRTPVAIEIDTSLHPFLLGLDAVVGIRQVVMYTLPEFVQAEPFVIGVSLDAAGTVLPILSPLLMAPQLNQHRRKHAELAENKPRPLPILVIDDSLTTRMLEQSIFEMEGYTVELASSAEEALTLAANRSFGLFLVDVEMPGMNGVAFIERIHTDAALRDIPAILVTSRGSPEDRARGLRAGARDYIVKSEFDQRYLIRRVRELIRTER